MAAPSSNSRTATRTATSDASAGGEAPPGAKSYRYTDRFYRYIEAGSIRSAGVVVPLVLRELSPISVLDVGCGAGAWLSEYRNLGVPDYLGVDGAYVQPSTLLIPQDRFCSQDIAKAFDLGRRFDVVQCLEVGEHIQEIFAETLVENLTRHGEKILFSAATPGQGGENHVNEQTHEFWRSIFLKRGYKPFDPIRPVIEGNTAVESWYRRNLLLYVAERAIGTLPPAITRAVVGVDQPIPEMSSSAYRLRARLVSWLPLWCVSKIALMKHNVIIAYRSLRGI
jgi:SAM-dependent methyltransferase